MNSTSFIILSKGLALNCPTGAAMNNINLENNREFTAYWETALVWVCCLPGRIFLNISIKLYHYEASKYQPNLVGLNWGKLKQCMYFKAECLCEPQCNFWGVIWSQLILFLLWCWLFHTKFFSRYQVVYITVKCSNTFTVIYLSFTTLFFQPFKIIRVDSVFSPLNSWWKFCIKQYLEWWYFKNLGFKWCHLP